MSQAISASSWAKIPSEPSSSAPHCGRHEPQIEGIEEGLITLNATYQADPDNSQQAHVRGFGFYTSSPVTLLIGGPSSPSREKSPVPFYAHRDLLTKASAFFRAAFSTNTNNHSSRHVGFEEAASKIMKLPEDRPQDIAYLLQYLYRRFFHSLSDLRSPNRTIAFMLWHNAVDGPLHKYETFKRLQSQLRDDTPKTKVKRTSKAVASAPEAVASVREATGLKRPTPPMFGPLVRLYLLADKYAVEADLKSSICRRVKEVGTQAKCVPEVDDVALLWGNCMEDSKNAGLKRVILDMYLEMERNSVELMFFAKDGAGGVTEQEDWHPLFMKDLVVELFQQLKPADGKGQASLKR